MPKFNCSNCCKQMVIRDNSTKIVFIFNESQRWNEFSQKSQITSIKREKCFPLVIDYYLKYCIEGRDLKITLSGSSFQKMSLKSFHHA